MKRGNFLAGRNGLAFTKKGTQNLLKRPKKPALLHVLGIFSSTLWNARKSESLIG